eukprot:COSAG05_NODE_11541_length_508_cov_1.290954_1_plen_24_part_01
MLRCIIIGELVVTVPIREQRLYRR